MILPRDGFGGWNVRLLIASHIAEVPPDYNFLLVLRIIYYCGLMAPECEIPYHLSYCRSPTRIQSPSFTSDFLASQNKWRVFVKLF